MTEPTKNAIMVTLIIGLGVFIIGYLAYIFPPDTHFNDRDVPQNGQTSEIVADIPQNPVQPSFKDLLGAIKWVESKGDPDAKGDGGLAVGCMQIHPIMVTDVNRILGWDGYTLDDRYDRHKSYQMFRIYTYHYCKGKDFEHIARCWNGGPSGYKKESTKAYWEKVKAVLYD